MSAWPGVASAATEDSSHPSICLGTQGAPATTTSALERHMRHTRTRARAVKAGILAAVVAAMVALVGFASRPASADLLNDRQKWLREAQAGLFLHWGMRTSPTFGSCTTWENAVNNTSQTGGRWEASKWVNAAKQLHTKYIVLAVFHSRLGYARAWPSKIPGSCATKRDFLRELLNAAHAADLKVINYMTDDPSHHNENGPEYLNSAAYSAFKGRTIDITTRDGFGEFSYDNFIELLDKYPDLDGFWIDNDNAVWERRGLYAHIHSLRPHMLLSNNNAGTPPDRARLQAAHQRQLVVQRRRLECGPQAHHRPLPRQRRIVDEVPHGRDRHGQR